MSEGPIGPTGKTMNWKDFRRLIGKIASGTPLQDRQISYTTPQGTHVTLFLHGIGTLNGTTVSPDGALNLVYNNTTAASTISAKVSGGTGRAPLATIRDADVSLLDQDRTASNPLALVSLRNFDLINGGIVNLSGGVGTLFLNSVGRNSQVFLRELPTTTSTSSSTSTTSTATSSGGLQFVTQSTGTTLAGVGGLQVPGAASVNTSTTSTSATTTTGFGQFAVSSGSAGGFGPLGGSNIVTGSGGTSSGSGAGVVTSTGGFGSINTSNITGTTTGTTGSSSSTSTSSSSSTSSTTIAGVGGVQVPGAASTGTTTTTTSTVVQGINVQIQHINGAAKGHAPLGDPNIYGYDSTTNALIRFDAKTGEVLQTIPLEGTGSADTGVGLGRADGRLLVLVGQDTTVRAFDALTGQAVGQFSTASLAANGLNAIDGIGSTASSTTLVDSSAGTPSTGSTTPPGLAQEIDLAASLASGQAVAVGDPFEPTREFTLNGGATGVAGSTSLYLTGAGYFDTFQPNQTQLGAMIVDTYGNTLRETDRGAFSNTNSLDSTQRYGLGSIDQGLALATSVQDGQNVVTLYDPSTFTRQDSIRLNDPNLLTDLSESFYPDLVDTALIDVQGTLAYFRANDATGLVLNDNGTLNQAIIHRAVDSTLIGRPIQHINIPQRSNVLLLSNRLVTTNPNGVTVDTNLRPIGPLTLP